MSFSLHMTDQGSILCIPYVPQICDPGVTPVRPKIQKPNKLTHKNTKGWSNYTLSQIWSITLFLMWSTVAYDFNIYKYLYKRK